MKRAILILLGTLVIATAYEAAIALELVEVGDDPDGAAPGAEWVVTLALVAAVGCAVVAGVLAARSQDEPLAALLAPACAAFLVAAYFTFDPYYLPNRQRYTEGIIPPGWIFGLGAAGLAAAWLVRALPVAGLALTMAVTLLSGCTASSLGVGK